MRLPLPFGYELRLSKRNLTFMQNGKIMSFANWLNGAISVANTPVLEMIYGSIASEFAKIDLGHVIDKKQDYKLVDDNLNYILSERPNRLQSKFDFLYTMAYQLYKYGNALAILIRDKKGNVVGIEPLNVTEYEMGRGYQFDEFSVFIKMRNKKTRDIELIPYDNLIHLRLNPNNVFAGDSFNDNNRIFVEVIDSALQSLLNELKDSGTVRGIIKIGNDGVGFMGGGFANRAMATNETKVSKQEEIINRIKQTQGGILVLDAGEDWKDLSSPFKTVSTEDLDQYIDMLLLFNGINKKVVDGTATEDEMEVFFNKTIVPRIEQLISEMNYKIFTKTARSQGHKIEFYRNPFEYVSIIKAIDIAYKGMQDTTTNERRRLIYRLPPIEGGDKLMKNKNFEEIFEGEETDGQ